MPHLGRALDGDRDLDAPVAIQIAIRPGVVERIEVPPRCPIHRGSTYWWPVDGRPPVCAGCRAVHAATRSAAR